MSSSSDRFIHVGHNRLRAWGRTTCAPSTPWPNCAVAALADTTGAARTHAPERAAAKANATADELLADPKVDAVVVRATPTTTHRDRAGALPGEETRAVQKADLPRRRPGRPAPTAARGGARRDPDGRPRFSVQPRLLRSRSWSTPARSASSARSPAVRTNLRPVRSAVKRRVGSRSHTSRSSTGSCAPSRSKCGDGRRVIRRRSRTS